MIEELLQKLNAIYDISMFFRGKEFINSNNWTQRKSVFIDKDFQVRYAVFFVGSIVLATISVIVPAFYLVNKNYQLFIDVAYQVVPQVVDSLEKERIGLLLGTICLGVSTCVFLAYIGFKQSLKLIGPIYVLKSHIMSICRGRWYIPIVRVRANDEFIGLVESYNYFYQSFRAHQQKELSTLKEINLNSLSKEDAWKMKKIIEEKQLQLTNPDALSDSSYHASSVSGSHDSRHAS